MTEDKKPVLPVSGLFGELSAGSDLTAEMILGKLMTSDLDLPLKSDVDDPVVLSVLDVLVDYAEGKSYTNTAKVLRCLLKSYRENRVSFKRRGRREIVDGVVADLQRVKQEGEGVGERLVGRGKR